jgi:hypothetical protein
MGHSYWVQIGNPLRGVREDDVYVDSDGLSPIEAVGRMAAGYRVSLAVRTMVVLDLADHLAAGPRSVADLAVATGTHAPSLARLLRALAALGLCAYDGRAGSG